jgi:hypothetical protein
MLKKTIAEQPLGNIKRSDADMSQHKNKVAELKSIDSKNQSFSKRVDTANTVNKFNALKIDMLKNPSIGITKRTVPAIETSKKTVPTIGMVKRTVPAIGTNKRTSPGVMRSKITLA